jgi:hypothetical protein
MEAAMARKHVQPGLFDLEDRYAALSKAGDALEAILAGPALHFAVDGKMPSAEERNERR